MLAALTLSVSLLTAPQVAHDSLYVSHDKTVYLLFESEVSMANAGTEDYIYEFNQNMVMVGANRAKVNPTSFMVKCKNGDVFVWYIAFRAHPPKLLIDTRKGSVSEVIQQSQTRMTGSVNQRFDMQKTSMENSNASVNNPGVTQQQLREEKLYGAISPPPYIREREQIGNRDHESSDPIIANKMFHILKQKKAYRDIGEVNNSIMFLLDDIYVDRQYIYLKISIHNVSSIAFEMDFLSFERQQGKSIKRREGSSLSQMDIFYKESVFSIAPSTQENIVYAIKLFAFQDNDTVLVKLSELGGVRTMKFTVPAKLITNAKSL